MGKRCRWSPASSEGAGFAGHPSAKTKIKCIKGDYFITYDPLEVMARAKIIPKHNYHYDWSADSTGKCLAPGIKTKRQLKALEVETLNVRRRGADLCFYLDLIVFVHIVVLM